MLIQFTVKNFLSFKNETTLDLSAVSAYKEHPYHLIELDKQDSLVKVAAIYGANASGKSNLILALRYFELLVMQSMNNADENEKTAIQNYYCPFMFDQESHPTEFEIVLMQGEYEYKYGFSYTESRICSEWLYRKSIVTNRNTKVFERLVDQFSFGLAVKRECEKFKDQIPKEGLVLSFFNRLKMKTDIFHQLYDMILDFIILDSDSFEDVALIEKILPGVIDDEKEKLLTFLNMIDTGIKDIYYEQENQKLSFFSVHLDSSDNQYDMNLYNESQGTLKSITMYVFAQAIVRYHGVMIVDELNTKLHPLLLKYLIDLFYDDESKAQLIYTTHDTTLMDKKFFRRDQIWFVQKDSQGHSELTALSDFKIRSDASFEKDYLSGVYGGIPFLKN